MNIIPQVGMGATICHWSDRTPATIIYVSNNGRKITLQEDNAVRLDNNGISELQEYTFNRNVNGKLYHATLRKDGKYRIVGGKELISLDTRNKYYDYSF